MAKGWFQIPGVQSGDRTLEQQLKGLSTALEECPGAKVLDLGAAEGLIGREFIEHGAERVDGVELNAAFVARANALRVQGLNVLHYDLNEGLPGQVRGPYDMVLALAIFHKLRDPLHLVYYIQSVNPGMVVVRLPSHTPGAVVDARSGHRRYDLTAEFRKFGYWLDEVATGHFDEWVGYYRKG